MHQYSTLYIALDVHKESIAVAYVAKAETAALSRSAPETERYAKEIAALFQHDRGMPPQPEHE